MIKVLRRPVEYAQYVSIRYTERLAEAGIEPSVGRGLGVAAHDHLPVLQEHTARWWVGQAFGQRTKPSRA